MSTKRTYDLENRLVEFANYTIQYIEEQPSKMAIQILGRQLIRSATSAALNYGEAQGAESKRDFIHKMRISLKELRESLVTIKLIALRPYSAREIEELCDECEQLIRIFVASIRTTEKN